MYVCICQAVTDSQIRHAAQAGATTLKDLRRDLGVTARMWALCLMCQAVSAGSAATDLCDSAAGCLTPDPTICSIGGQ